MARRRPKAGSGGFSLLELVIVLCLIGMLTALGLQRLWVLRAEAERASLVQIVGGLQSALAMELLSRVAGNREDELESLSDSNPMELLAQQPVNYIGELDAPDPRSIAPGRWYFDRSDALLVYRVRYAERFHSPLGEPARARFRVAFVYEDRDGDRRFDADADGIGGIRLEPVEPYRWKKWGS